MSEEASLAGSRLSAFYTASEATNNRVVSIVMHGLKLDTPYYYGVESEGVVDLTKIGRFHTPVAQPLSFTFAFGSCAQTGSTHPVFDTIRDESPLFLMHMGDLHYENIVLPDPALYRAAYDLVLASPEQAALYRSTPLAYMWDDHDYGPNNSDATSPGRLAARLTYQQYVPHYPLPAGSGDVPIHQAFSIGRVRFIVTDSRSERTPYLDPDTPAKTMLGDEQKAWFKQELLDAKGVYPVIVWVNTLPWIGTTGDDGWYVYTNERKELANFIAAHQIEGVFMISGDAHMLAIDDGTNSDYATGGGAGFPVMHAAALDQTPSVKGGPYSEGAFPGPGQFALMTITDTGFAPICVQWSGRDALDQEIVGFIRCLPALPSPDTDGDGHIDLLDCAFADDAVWAAPGPVEDLSLVVVPGGVELSWASQDAAAGPATSYDVVMGGIGELVADHSFADASCLVGSLADGPFVDLGDDPRPGEGFYFLVRAVNACGSGSYGHAGPADPRYALDGDEPCPFP